MNRTGNGPLAQQNQGDSASAGDGMERGLSNRHVQFIAIGGTIGTGLFLGSGKSIALTGPSIILVYIGVGLIMYLLMRAIGELMYRSPVQHTFIAFISRYLGQGWGSFAGWSYWIVLILIGMSELNDHAFALWNRGVRHMRQSIHRMVTVWSYHGRRCMPSVPGYRHLCDIAVLPASMGVPFWLAIIDGL